MRLFFLLFTILLIACKGEESQLNQQDVKLSEAGFFLTQKVANLLDSGKQEEAQEVLFAALDSADIKYNQIDRYYIHSLLAEVMYYAAMNEQGLLSAEASLQHAIELNNDTFIGNSFNLIGIIHLNADRYTDAGIAFNKAIKFIPINQKNYLLSRADQVRNNLAELYLNINQPDSAMIMAQSALEISLNQKKYRAICFAYWGIGKAHRLKNEPEKAKKAFISGISVCPPKETDVLLHLTMGLLDIASMQKDKIQILQLCEKGDSLLTILEEHDFARSRYLEKKTAALLVLGEFKKATEAQQQLLELKEEIRQNRELLNQRQLKAYFNNEKQLFIANQSKEKQAEELANNRKIQIILSALMFVLILLFYIFRRWSIQKQRLQLYRFEQEQLKIEKQKELELLKERYSTLENERNRIARELHDDIGSSMSAITIFSEIAAKEIHDDQSKLKDLNQRTSEKAKEVSESLSDLIWAIYSKNDSWSSLIDRIRNFSFEILTNKGIEAKIEDDFNLGNKLLPIDLKKNLLLFCKEAMNNISKYSKANLAFIRFELRDGWLHLNISDNGIGFDPGTIGKGNGLQSMHNRAKALNGKMELISAPGKGTMIKLSLPFENTIQEEY